MPIGLIISYRMRQPAHKQARLTAQSAPEGKDADHPKRKQEVKAGATYLAIMESNLAVLKEALN